jgi:hypothetical protein
MGILTEEMKRVVAQRQLCYTATVTPDGKPNLSPKGSITVLSDDELGLADLASAREYPQNPPPSQGGDSKVNIRHQGHDR